MKIVIFPIFIRFFENIFYCFIYQIKWYQESIMQFQQKKICLTLASWSKRPKSSFSSLRSSCAEHCEERKVKPTIVIFLIFQKYLSNQIVPRKHNFLAKKICLTLASWSKRPKSSFSSLTSSCAEHCEERTVKPTMSAKRMLTCSCLCMQIL